VSLRWLYWGCSLKKTPLESVLEIWQRKILLLCRGMEQRGEGECQILISHFSVSKNLHPLPFILYNNQLRRTRQDYRDVEQTHPN
jgi:hypothetical protein